MRPDELLADPDLEAAPANLSQGLRCLVCRNENIDDSDAPLAHDLRVLLRERLQQGDSDEAAIAFITDRYGEFVLLRPEASGANLLLWLAGPLLLLTGAGLAFTTLRHRAPEPDPEPLSDEDLARLKSLTDETS